MLEQITASAPHVVAMRAAGRVNAQELQKIIDTIEEAKRRHPKVSLYAEIDAMRWMTLTALLRDLGYGLTQMGQLSHFHRVAITSDRTWIRPLAMLENQLFKPLEVRVFPNSEKQAAMDWVCQLPGASTGTGPRQSTTNTARETG